jgi:hypothetical protein
MKNMSKSNVETLSKLESFLNSNTEFEFQKVSHEGSPFVTYEIEKTFNVEKRAVTLIQQNSPNEKEIFYFSTKKDYELLIKHINNPKKTAKSGYKTYGNILRTNKMIKWLNNPQNEELWFPQKNKN